MRSAVRRADVRALAPHRATGDPLVLVRRTVPLAALLNAVRDRVARRIAERPVAFHVVATDGVIDVDPARIVEVLAIVAGNAIAAAPRGGRVAVSAQLVEDEAVFAIYDVGARVDDLEAYWARGPGGRVAVQRTVDAHGGRLWLDRGGRGNVLLFTVPAPRTP